MSRLAALSNELFEIVAQHLDLQDVCNLRLSSRAISYKATQDTFRSFFRCKTIDLTRDGLQEFAQVTEFSRLACGVEELSLAGIVYNPTELENIIQDGCRMQPVDTDGDDPWESLGNDYTLVTCTEEELKRAQDELSELRRRQQDLVEFQANDDDFSLLRRAFSNIAETRSGQGPGLSSLALEVVTFRKNLQTRLVPRKGKAWKWIFQAADRAIRLALTCCLDSNLRVQRLSAFATRPESIGCSTTCDALASLDWEALQPVFKSLKALRISVSSPIIDASEGDVTDTSGDPDKEVDFELVRTMRDPEPLRRQILDDTTASVMGRMLGMAEHLEELDISVFRPDCRNRELNDVVSTMLRRYMFHLARMEKPLIHLRQLRLAGFQTSQEDLSMFLEASSVSLQQLELSTIRLAGDGTWDPIMSLLKSMNLQKIFLEDLARKQMVLFEDVDSDCTKVDGVFLQRNTITVWGEDTKKQIACGPYGGMSVDTPKTRLLQKRKRLEYGRT